MIDGLATSSPSLLGEGLGWGSLPREDHLKLLHERAKEMRRNPTPFEIIVWRNLSRSQLCGFKFRRQHVIYPFIVDFFCPSKALIVEIDGNTHIADDDAKRDARLNRQGYSTLRFTNEDVTTNIDGVAQSLLTRLERLPDRWPVGEQPHPNPSPEGEGLRK